MTCPQVQTNLSLYLYGELDFAEEEELERHLHECALCRQALAREKSWHTALNAEHTDVPLDLLSACRRDLRSALSSAGPKQSSFPLNWLDRLGISSTAWSMRVAAASFLVVIGFTAARWMDRSRVPDLGPQTAQMGVLGVPSARVRDIQPDGNHQVRIVFDQVLTREITGRAADDDVRRLLLAAMKDPSDPGIRLDSTEALKGQDGSDVRQALLYSARHDSNAAVRLKAVEALRGFTSDPATRDTLTFVLQHDDNPGVRSEAIDVLAPAGEPVQFNPDLAATLQQIAQSEREDDYVRMRCVQLLGEMKASLDVY